MVPRRLSIKLVEETNKELNGLKNFSRKLRGAAINSETSTGFLLARIFGIISPNNNRTEVIRTTCIKKTTHASDVSLMKNVVKNVEIITIATLMKLFVIRMVASNFLGFRRSCKTLSFFLLLCNLSLSASVGLNEKKAVSEPEIRPETINKTTSTTNVRISSNGKPLKISVIKTIKGSGRGSGSLISKIIVLVQQIFGKSNIKMANHLLLFQLNQYFVCWLSVLCRCFVLYFYCCNFHFRYAILCAKAYLSFQQ